MENDLISRSALMKRIKQLAKDIARENGGVDHVTYAMKVAFDMAKEAPAVDAEVVRHGRWIMRGGYIRCSECDAKTLWKDTGGTGGFSHEYEQVRSVHCHNCGAKMDGDKNGK